MINEGSSSEGASDDNSVDDEVNDSRQPALNDLEHLVAIGPNVIAPDTEGESESEEEEEEKESGPKISEPSPPPSSKGLENA